jgi:hypothetical protein
MHDAASPRSFLGPYTTVREIAGNREAPEEREQKSDIHRKTCPLSPSASFRKARLMGAEPHAAGYPSADIYPVIYGYSALSVCYRHASAVFEAISACSHHIPFEPHMPHHI